LVEFDPGKFAVDVGNGHGMREVAVNFKFPRRS
jgi:hypothetical protein